MKRLPIHPLADLLPRMTPAEYEALKRDVARTNGPVEKIVLLDGKILDGRHRADACYDLGIEPPTQDFKRSWGSPVEYVYSKAVHRNLTDSQKACAAVAIEDQLAVEAVARSRANLKQNAAAGAEVAPGATSEANGKSRDAAGGLFGVSGSYVRDARHVRNSDPKLFASVLAGQVKLSVARREVHRAHKRAVHQRKAAAAPPGAGTWRLSAVDCLDGLRALPRRCARQIVLDPPYNIGINYGRGEQADLLPADEYVAYWRERLAEAAEVLAGDGSLWVVQGDEFAAEFVVAVKGLGLRLRSWVKWYESFGTNVRDGFNRCSRHVLYFTRTGEYVFHPDAVNRPSDRQAKYQDPRAHPGGKTWDNVWGINPPIPRLVDNAAERLPDFPTQLPLALARPIVGCATDPGDLVVDLCNGSGTFSHAAVEAGRHALAFDVSPRYVELAARRLEGVGTRRETDVPTVHPS